MRFRFRLAIAGFTAVLSLAGAAQAALPTTHNTLIVPGKSIGGAKLGSTLSQAAGVWGKSECNDLDGECSYEGKGFARVECSSTLPPPTGLACAVIIEFISARTFGPPNYATPLTRFKTPRGIGLGSSLTQLHHAYPHLKKEGSGYVTYTLAGPGKSSTQFTVYKGRVSAILIEA
jgi:hypothetical protein